MNKLLAAPHTNKLCYIDNNYQLWLTYLDGSTDILIDHNKNFVSTICSINLHKKILFIKTVNNDIYCYKVSRKRSPTNIYYLGNYEIINTSWAIIGNCYCLVIASNSSVMLFHNFKLKKKYVLPNGERVQYFSRIKGNCLLFCIGCDTDTNKTYIANDSLVILTTLKNTYSNIATHGIYNYCIKENGRVDIYDERWTFVRELKLEIKNIYKHFRLVLIDRDNKYYYLRDKRASLVPSVDNIVQYNPEEKCVTMFTSCYHLGRCSCNNNYTYVIFETSMTIFDEINCTTFVHDFDFNKFVIVTKFNSNNILLIDYDGIISLLEYHIENNQISISNNYVHDNEIKPLRYKVNIKKSIV
jgi:hypothetical protein